MGGAATFAALTREFYRGVAQDPLLRPMYPEADLEPARERLELFLAQYWGGPTTYSDRRGHPRLRMRHMGFAVTPAARDAWLRHMLAAVDTLDLEPTDEAMLRDYLTRAAYSLVNRME
ncbi:MAG: globin [Austwickia sp.]|nr:globin [Austwickia sp.]